MKKMIGRCLRKILPWYLYKLIANGFIIVPKYYKDIIKDAENYTADLEVLQRNKDHISELCDSDTWLRYDI